MALSHTNYDNFLQDFEPSPLRGVDEVVIQILERKDNNKSKIVAKQIDYNYTGKDGSLSSFHYINKTIQQFREVAVLYSMERNKEMPQILNYKLPQKLASADSKDNEAEIAMTWMGDSLHKVHRDQATEDGFNQTEWCLSKNNFALIVQQFKAIMDFHELGFYHFDVKSQNMTLKVDDLDANKATVHLIDFGTVGEIPSMPGSHLVCEEFTPEYLPPEGIIMDLRLQVGYKPKKREKFHHFDATFDLYQLGMMIFMQSFMDRKDLDFLEPTYNGSQPEEGSGLQALIDFWGPLTFRDGSNAFKSKIDFYFKHLKQYFDIFGDYLFFKSMFEKSKHNIPNYENVLNKLEDGRISRKKGLSYLIFGKSYADAESKITEAKKEDKEVEHSKYILDSIGDFGTQEILGIDDNDPQQMLKAFTVDLSRVLEKYLENDVPKKSKLSDDQTQINKNLCKLIFNLLRPDASKRWNYTTIADSMYIAKMVNTIREKIKENISADSTKKFSNLLGNSYDMTKDDDEAGTSKIKVFTKLLDDSSYIYRKYGLVPRLYLKKRENDRKEFYHKENNNFPSKDQIIQNFSYQDFAVRVIDLIDTIHTPKQSQEEHKTLGTLSVNKFGKVLYMSEPRNAVGYTSSLHESFRMLSYYRQMLMNAYAKKNPFESDENKKQFDTFINLTFRNKDGAWQRRIVQMLQILSKSCGAQHGGVVFHKKDNTYNNPHIVTIEKIFTALDNNLFKTTSLEFIWIFIEMISGYQDVLGNGSNKTEENISKYESKVANYNDINNFTANHSVEWLLEFQKFKFTSAPSSSPEEEKKEGEGAGNDRIIKIEHLLQVLLMIEVSEFSWWMHPFDVAKTAMYILARFYSIDLPPLLTYTHEADSEYKVDVVARGLEMYLNFRSNDDDADNDSSINKGVVSGSKRRYNTGKYLRAARLKRSQHKPKQRSHRELQKKRLPKRPPKRSQRRLHRSAREPKLEKTGQRGGYWIDKEEIMEIRQNAKNNKTKPRGKLYYGNSSKSAPPDNHANKVWLFHNNIMTAFGHFTTPDNEKNLIKNLNSFGKNKQDDSIIDFRTKRKKRDAVINTTLGSDEELISDVEVDPSSDDAGGASDDNDDSNFDLFEIT